MSYISRSVRVVKSDFRNFSLIIQKFQRLQLVPKDCKLLLVKSISQKIVIFVIWTVLNQIKSMSSNQNLFSKVKTKLILSKNRECVTSLWLNRPLLDWRGLGKTKSFSELMLSGLWSISVFNPWFLTDQRS